jgi:hypothetical protein
VAAVEGKVLAEVLVKQAWIPLLVDQQEAG